MANKFILVPEEIYRGLTTHDTGNLNLDFVKHSLDKLKKENLDPSTKNVLYNQELRRYLHLLKEHENKPVKVSMVGNLPGPPVPIQPEASETESSRSSQRRRSRGSRTTSQTSSTLSRRTSLADTEQQSAADDEFQDATASSFDPTLAKTSTPKEGHIERIHNLISKSPNSFLIQGDKILADNGKKVIQGSSVKESLKCIIEGERGNWKTVTPPGTLHLENRLRAIPTINSIIKSAGKYQETPKRITGNRKKPKVKKPAVKAQSTGKLNPSLWNPN